MKTLVKLTLLFYVLFIALPFILIAINQKIQFIESLRPNELGVSIFISIWGLLTTTAAFLVKTTAWCVLPVACMWAAELNADYFVTNQQRYKAALLRELSKKNGKITWWRWILFRLSHPPESLRRIFVRRSDSYVFSLMLLIFPLTMFVRIVVLHIWTFFVYQGIGTSSIIAGQTTEFTWQNYLQSLVDNTRLAVTSNPFDWLLMTGLLLVWTVAVYPWERFFTRGHEPWALSAKNDAYSPEIASSNITPQQFSRFKHYALAATLTSVVFFVALVWRE